MLKKLVLLTALTSTAAFAQQNTDISGADFSSGKGDAALAAAARKAAASGKRLVITAPQEWHQAIAAKIRAGGTVDVVLRDGFYENVLVRSEAKPEAEKPPRTEPKSSAATSPAARPVVAKPVAPPPSPAPAVVASPVPPSVVATPPPVPAPARPAASAPPKPAPAVDAEVIYNRLQAALIGGRSAEGPLAVAALQPGDTLYVDEPVRGVIRRVAGRPYLYWLDGPLDLRRSELKVVEKNRYQVMSPIKGEGSLRREFDASTTLQASEPPADAPGRRALERTLNEGRTISRRLEVARLRSGDLLYTGTGVAVVVHRDGKDLQRFWLDGSIDLLQSGLQADGPGKYRVVSDAIR